LGLYFYARALRCPNPGLAQDVMLQQASAELGLRYEVVDIDPFVVDALRRRGYDSFSSHFGDSRLSAEPVIGVGDSVTVTIWGPPQAACSRHPL
jgi:polysaccharide export outer membrane protein